MAPVKAMYWQADAGYRLDSIDPNLFTHIFCAFANLNPSTNTIGIPFPDFTRSAATLRQINPSVKILLSIGGGAGDQLAREFANMANNPFSRTTFINSCIQVARANFFDGLDLDYEYPFNEADMANLGALLSEWRQKINESSGSPLLLTAAVRYRNSNYAGNPYPVAAIVTNLDWINVMAYDFWAPGWADRPVTGPAAALNGTVSGRSGINDWINAGVPANKLVLGIPFYGYAWTLADPNNHGYGAPTTGSAVTRDGAMTYRDIKAFQALHPGVSVYDIPTAGNYFYSGTTWISFDDEDAVRAKVRFVRENQLLGYFAWRHGGDDEANTLATTAFRNL